MDGQRQKEKKKTWKIFKTMREIHLWMSFKTHDLRIFLEIEKYRN